MKFGVLPCKPNLLGIYPVNFPPTRKLLGCKTGETSVAELKKRAIRLSVEEAFRRYGQSPYHRFGMSDDDPQNIQLIIEAMTELKKQYSRNAFFVIKTQKGVFQKTEIFLDHVEKGSFSSMEQLDLF